MQRIVLALVILAGCTSAASADDWVNVYQGLWVDTSTMFTDADGFVRYQTREVDDEGKVLYQHKEAVDCVHAQHYFRKMYEAADAVNNRDDSDVDSDEVWRDWRNKAWNAYNIDELVAVRDFVCSG
jgi:hypothetical protein